MNNSPFGRVIFSYTRAQAIADGVLIDVSSAALDVGFRHPVALTSAVWADCVAWADADSELTCLISSGHFNLGERPRLLQLNNTAA
ncbi:ISBma1, transposase [Burkholderia pseudomallei]|nr:ISBma1, transposase [Burkholderia pseudomallei]CAJ7268437.1 ISBma1, transposase [Burkholderia pseudomallei]